jgi:hypothetical protein
MHGMGRTKRLMRYRSRDKSHTTEEHEPEPRVSRVWCAARIIERPLSVPGVAAVSALPIAIPGVTHMCVLPHGPTVSEWASPAHKEGAERRFQQDIRWERYPLSQRAWVAAKVALGSGGDANVVGCSLWHSTKLGVGVPTATYGIQ